LRFSPRRTPLTKTGLLLLLLLLLGDFLCKSLIINDGAGEGNRILSQNVHNSLNGPIIVHCKRHIFHHLRIKRHGDDQTLMQIDASANVISRPCALMRSYHNPANWRVKTEILSGPPERARSVKASASGIGVHEVLTSGAGLGRREARRRGLGMAPVPNDRKTAEPLPVQPREFLRAVNPPPA